MNLELPPFQNNFNYRKGKRKEKSNIYLDFEILFLSPSSLSFPQPNIAFQLTVQKQGKTGKKQGKTEKNWEKKGKED